RRKGRELGDEPPAIVEQLLRPVRPEPFLQHGAVLGIRSRRVYRHLVRTPGAFDRLAVDGLRSGPALWRSEHDHRGGLPPRVTCTAGLVVDAANLDDGTIECRGHQLMHR